MLIDRPNVCRIEWLTIRSNGSPTWRALFSRIRSKTTIVSWTLKPMTVSIGGHEQGVDLDAEERAEDRERPDDDEHVVDERDERGRAELDVVEPDRHPDEDAERAERGSRSAACWISSSLITGPTVDSERWASIGPNSSWMPVGDLTELAGRRDAASHRARGSATARSTRRAGRRSRARGRAGRGRGRRGSGPPTSTALATGPPRSAAGRRRG